MYMVHIMIYCCHSYIVSWQMKNASMKNSFTGRIPAGDGLTFFLAMMLASMIYAQEDTIMKSSQTPPQSGGNAFNSMGRKPLFETHFAKLPLGCVHPAGWLRKQLELEADGFTGHLTEISQWCRFEGSAWVSKDGAGAFGWEELPYWLKGYLPLGHILNNNRIIVESNKWIDGVLSSQDADGYFGPVENKKKCDLWPNMIMLCALRSHYEATDDKRVVPFMLNYFRWQSRLPLESFLHGSWQKWRAGDNLDSILWLYNQTGEEWLIDLARVNHDCSADWKATFPTWHGVNICQCFREPGQYFQVCGDRRYLDAAYRNFRIVMDKYGQVPGGMFGADENCREGYSGPRQAAETCSMAELMFSSQILTRISGDAFWADVCEDVAFNSLPASMTPDLKGLHYLTAPNMVQLDRASKAPLLQNGGDMLSFNPHDYRCCQHNVAFGWPYFSENLWMAARGNGLAAVLYAPCEVKAKVGDGTEVTITEKTEYPFGDSVEFTITCAKAVRFPLVLRIPKWCAEAKVSLAGKQVDGKAIAGQWATIEREWKSGDQIRLDLPMNISVRVWERNDGSISVDRGPLTFSLKIAERWTKYGDSEKWPGYEVFPASAWNYGLVLDPADPAKSFTTQPSGKPLAAQPFTPDDAPITLKAKGRKIPEWQLEANGLVGAIGKSPVISNEPEEDVTLIPMGCARLRISAFPRVAGQGARGEAWDPRGCAPSASHVNPGDTVLALNDGILPKSSGDQGVARFTWWDHLGTAEWAQYAWPKAKRVTGCKVYWFDDTGKGQCRVPEAWRVLWLDGAEWKPVENASEYGCRTDALNEVKFKEVETTGLRIEVRLKPGFSGGILEWAVEERE